MPPIGPAALLAAARDRDPARPLLTHYDDSTGERVELSATTLDNWVAKTANLLQDEFDVGPGSTVAVSLPVHWQTAAVLLGVWSCGGLPVDRQRDGDRGAGTDVELVLEQVGGLGDPVVQGGRRQLHPLTGGVVVEGDEGAGRVAVLLGVWSCGAAVVDTASEDDGGLADVDVVLAAQDRLAALEEEDADVELLGLSLHPLGAGMTGYVGQARDFALEVRSAGDRFVPYSPPDPAAPGLVAGGLQLTLGGLVETARELAGRLGIGADDRILVDGQVAAEAGPVAWLLAPLAAGASLVLCRHPRPEGLAARAAAERVTATLGPEIDGIRALGRPA